MTPRVVAAIRIPPSADAAWSAPAPPSREKGGATGAVVMAASVNPSNAGKGAAYRGHPHTVSMKNRMRHGKLRRAELCEFKARWGAA
jgi:hypothetical protein